MTMTSTETRIALQNGQTALLGPKLAAGGEGTVYGLLDPNLQHLVVKLYHPESSDRRRRRQQRIEQLCALPAIRDDKRFAWPRALVFNENKEWTGYVMHRAAGSPIEVLCHPQKIQRRFPGADRLTQAKLCLALVQLFRRLHDAGILAGDINTANILVPQQKMSPTLIDCDSVQFSSSQQLHLCEVGVGAFTAPELQGKRFESTPRTIESELFAIAVLFFKILMLGLHPFSFSSNGERNLEDEGKNILRGDCALGKGTGLRLPRGHWFNIWSHLTFPMKTLFIRCFRDGHRDPKSRPTLQDWEKALQNYIFALGKGYVSSHLIPKAPKISQKSD